MVSAFPLTDEIKKQLEQNPYYAGCKKDQIIFTRAFHVEMYKKVILEGRTYVEAYNELGFPTALLGEARATAVGMRIMKMAKEHKLFRLGDPFIPDEEAVYLYNERTEFLEKLREMLMAC